MTDLSASNQAVKKSNALTLWMIVLIFALPPLAAYFMYFSGIMPDARMNKGTLLEAKELPDVLLQTLDKQPYTIKQNSGKWTLLMMVETSCDDGCKKNIYLMRQVRTSLGKDSHNTSRLLVLSEKTMSDVMTDFLRDYPDMPIVTGNQNDIQKLNSFLVSVAGESLNKVFIIYPYGKVMMHYAQELQPKDLLSDLKRLILVNSNELTDNTQ